MSEYDISNVTTIDSFSGKSESVKLENSESETITIDDENASLLRRSNTSSFYRNSENDEYWGLLFMVLSTIAFTTMILCVKVANKNYPFLQAVFTRSIFQVIGGYVGCKIIRVRPWGDPEHRFLLICRGACGAIGMILFFAGISCLPLADNTVILFAGPATTAIIAWFILDEKLTKLDGFLSSISLLGIIIMASPEFIFSNSSQYSAVNYLLPFFGACMGSFTYIIIRFIGHGVHYLVHTFYFGIVSSVISGFSLFVFHTQEPILPESTYDWVIHILIGVSAFLAQCFLNKGFLLCPVGKGTLMRNLDVISAFIIGISVFGEVPNWNSIIGSLIIVGCHIGMNIKNLKPKEREPTDVAVVISIEESQNDNIVDIDV